MIRKDLIFSSNTLSPIANRPSPQTIEPSTETNKPSTEVQEEKNRQFYDSYFSDVPEDKYSFEQLKQKLHNAGILTDNKYSNKDFFIISAKRHGRCKEVV